MNAVMQFIRGGIIAVTARGPYGPIRALMGPILFKKLSILMKDYKINDKI